MQPRANSDKICIPGLRKRVRSVPEYCPMTTARCAITFPANFLWGCATSAHQIEGSPLADGAAPSIWQRFADTPGLVRDGDTGDVACDHYRRYADDVALMGRLGLKAYRFSISWSRVLPQGAGAVNPAGLAFYDRLTDALLRHGIAPMVTLYHWDLPAALDDRGGWLNPDAAKWFAEYAAIVFRKLDDRVKLWATLNEPWVVTDGGYLRGALAPGHRNLFEAPIATHQLLRAHGAAIQAYRTEGRHQIGLVVNLEPKHAASSLPEDAAATQRADAYTGSRYWRILRASAPRVAAGCSWRVEAARLGSRVPTPPNPGPPPLREAWMDAPIGPDSGW